MAVSTTCSVEGAKGYFDDFNPIFHFLAISSYLTLEDLVLVITLKYLCLITSMLPRYVVTMVTDKMVPLKNFYDQMWERPLLTYSQSVHI